MCMHRFSAWIPVLRAWVCEVCANWTAAHVRVPEPVMPHGPGETGWSSDGWGAQLLIRGRDTELGELEKIKEASDAFHACISSMRWSMSIPSSRRVRRCRWAGSPADSPPNWWHRETGTASTPSWDRWTIRAQSSG